MRRTGGVLALAIAAAAVLPAAAQARQFVIVGTGDPTGVYFAAGNAVCRAMDMAALKGRDHGIRCSAPATGGSIANLKDLAAGEIDLAVVQSDVQFDAFNAVDSARVPPMTELRSVLSLHAEPLQIVVSPNSGIARWADLGGRRLGVGNQTSAVHLMLAALIRAHGANPTDFASLVPMPTNEQTTALCAGRIDAYAVTIGVPNALVAQALASCGAGLLELDDDAAQWLIETHPYYAAITIPAGGYRMLKRPVHTFGVLATLVTTQQANTDMVYEVTRAVFENLDTLRRLHPALANLDAAAMVKDGLAAPLHPGAARYYEERGWL